MSRQNTFPKSTQQNVREISRQQYQFDSGMLRDIVGTDVGPGTHYPKGVTYLNNCRGYLDGIRGDTGSVRFVAAKFAVTITNNLQSMSTAIHSGEVFLANNNSIPDKEIVFEVKGSGDFIGGELTTAKGSHPRPYDNFKFTNTDTGLEAVVYLGNSRIPAVPGYGDTESTEISATKSGDIITRVSGPEFVSSLVGNFFVWDYGLRDPITEFIDENTIRVANSETKSGSMCRIEAPIYASYHHKSLNKFVILAGERIYIAKGIPFLGWTEVTRLAAYPPAKVLNHPFYEDNKDLILVNSNGIYRIKLSSDEPYYYMQNEPAPAIQLSDGNTTNTLPYGYRGMYAMAFITGAGINCDRFSDDAVLEHVSAPTKKNSRDGVDYAQMWRNTAIDGTNTYTWGTFNYPYEARSFTHYVLYRTKSVGVNGIALGNKENIFLWTKDVPVAKGLTAYRSADGVITVTKGKLEKADIGCTIYWADGTTDLVDSYLSIESVQTDNLSAKTEQSCCIGSETVLTVSQTEKSITVENGRVLTSADEGKLIYLANGFTLIKKVLSSTIAEAAWTAEYESQGACIDPTFREITDDVSDEILSARYNSGDSIYFLQNRFFEPLPTCNIGLVIAGFLLVAQSDKNEYYYCELGRRELVGYYKPTEQYSNKIWDGIVHLRPYPDQIIIRCKHSTYRIPTNITDNSGNEDLGESYQILKDPEIIDDAIGSLTANDSIRLPNGNELVFTSEPAFRLFNGVSYGDKLDSYAINKTETRLFVRPIIFSYSPRQGLRIWGRQE